MGERKMADISVMDAERLCGWLPRRARETHKEFPLGVIRDKDKEGA